MSRIGKQPIIIPDGVTVDLKEGEITVKGPKGELKQSLSFDLEVTIADNAITIKPKKKIKSVLSLWGLTRSLINNMIIGVKDGFEKKLEINGVGYRAELQGNKLVLQLGLSHPVIIEAPEGITFTAEKNLITVSGFDKQLVGQISATIRSKKKPEPYKGKGIKYSDEVIIRKVGKKGAGTE